MRYIKRFDEVTLRDVALVGGKNASLGTMIAQLTSEGIRVPRGFAVISDAYWEFIQYNDLKKMIAHSLQLITKKDDLHTLQKEARNIRQSITEGVIPEHIADEIKKAYDQLNQYYDTKDLSVAARSSATAEDLPEASFAGQQETLLNVVGIQELFEACKKCMASLFTDRAIIYRQEKKIDHMSVALSVGVQKMVRSDKASSGVIFTLETETGFKDLVIINGAYGLGEAVVKGIVNPDEFWVHKPTFEQGYKSIVKKTLGQKGKKIVFADTGGTKEILTTEQELQSFCLNDREILQLAGDALKIERIYSQKYERWMPMDIEWAKDGIDNQLYILQARPETVHAQRQTQKNELLLYSYDEQPPSQRDKIVSGMSIGSQIVTGIARIIQSIDEVKTFNEGDILVTFMTDPDWVPIMKKATAIVTDAGGRTSHAAIVSRELGKAGLVGTNDATKKIVEGQKITVDCAQGSVGFVYDGEFTIKKERIDIGTLPKPPVELLVNIADPDRAIPISQLPVSGVGLARIEFIISNVIKIHPMVAIKPSVITDAAVRKKIEQCRYGYPDLESYFVDVLAQGIATIAAAFYPRFVLVRFSDFKSNEYRNLLGGSYFEKKEENPMLGLRGASRYYSDSYKPAFALECAAIKRVRAFMGFKNVHVMVPFVRTVDEAKQVLDLMIHHDLKRHHDDLLIFMMCEIPSNVILIDEFSKLFDGISIGSNDLTQMVLAVDRDSPDLAALFDERNEAVKIMMQLAVEGARRNKIKSSICGQAPSDYPALASFLVDVGINSISLNPDAVLSFVINGFGARK